MAKAKTDTSFWGNFLVPGLFKPNQGRVVRQVTAGTVAIIMVTAAWRLRATLLIEKTAAISVGVPLLISAAGLWFAYRLINWPVFANFLISVEAELDKVSWADWAYLKRATVVVLVVMFAMGAYLYVADIFWQQLFGAIGFLDLDTVE
ncbi:preprotein translocase subunit SecE [Thalassoglobus polymorphus]|uniref:Protein translocase subunit SecE n=1 Tax=Thalassoglobus polymorphus TaxID=2527994 RepID=A0A517QSM7_9PLAN|nr:preprotein translocase subunit SecE [Thalassoglobus polymorphus]QDT34625.1 preprotein translocase subunit SecE [Thalassoglobus polymorphus]